MRWIISATEGKTASFKRKTDVSASVHRRFFWSHFKVHNLIKGQSSMLQIHNFLLGSKPFSVIILCHKLMADARPWYWVKYPYWKNWFVGFKTINLCGYFTLQWVDFYSSNSRSLKLDKMQTINNRLKQPAAQNTLMNHRLHPPTAGGISDK